MDMVQVNDLDDPVNELVESLGSPGDLQDPKRGTRWDEYELVEGHNFILKLFRTSHGKSIIKGLPVQPDRVTVREKCLVRFSADDGLSVKPNTLVVLIPLFNSSTCVKYTTEKMGGWEDLPWEPGTFIRVPWSGEVRAVGPPPAYSLMIEFTWTTA